MVRKQISFAGLFAGAVFAAPLALAQEAKDVDRATDSVALQDVIVTARRRAESAQSVPISITVKSQIELDELNIESVGDLQFSTPSLSASGPFRDQPLVVIRGQGGFTPGGIPSVILNLNEVPAATSAQSGSPGGMLGGNDLLFDLENVQVLKGPQGTLFGRNSTGGAILVQTRRPGKEIGGSIQVTGGNYDNKEIDVAFDLPIFEDKLFARLAVSGQDRQGFTKAASTPSHPNGLDLDDANYLAGRLSLLYTPTDSIENLLIVDAVSSRTNGTSNIVTAINPALAGLFGPSVNTLVAQQNARGIRSIGAQSSDLKSELERYSATNIFTWDVNDHVTFKNITSFQTARYGRAVDGDGTRFPIFDPVQRVNALFETNQFTEEAQFQFSDLLGGLLDATVGAFYLDSPEPDAFSQHRNQVRLSPGGVAPGLVGVSNSESSQALFAQGDVDLSALLDGLSATAGVRYTWDSISRKLFQRRSTGACASTQATPATCITSRSGEFEAPTWTLGLNYQVTPSTLMYVASRRGYRAGGFNLDSGVPLTDLQFDEEYVTDVELGVKADWDALGLRGRSNLAVYKQFYEDIQLSEVIGPNVSVVRNAGEAEIEGAEFETRLFIGDRLELGAQVGLLDFEYTKLNPGVSLPAKSLPEVTYGIDGVLNVMKSEELGDISLRASWNAFGERYITSIIEATSFQEEFGLLTLGANWRNVGGRPVDLSFFMTNATDEDYLIGALPQVATVGSSSVSYGEPQMWGVRLGYRFGAEK